MNSETSREHKIKFIKSFGRHALETAISKAVARFGAENFLTDEQLDEITEQQVRDARSYQHFQMRNRKTARAA
ncbi:hypothetical protein [Brucella pituitosa]|uniref:hypothetical protein n=1 Tax=Brucella pituitosa TaxID=571256 RepID=UPI003F4AAA17